MNQQQNPNSQMKDSSQMPAQQSHSAHEIFDARESIDGLIGTMEHYKMYEQGIQDQQLQNILNSQYQYMSQLYNTVVDAFQTGQRPPQPTTNYNMELSNDVTYGLSPSQPKQPKTNPQQIDDQCYSSFMLGHLKNCATSSTMAALEATNPVVRRVFQDSIPNFCEMAYEVFLYQNDNNYYQVPQFDQQTQNQLLNSYTHTQTQQH
ncbi:spore coat protein [Tenuibacillus multivorans]|uniref:Spore coat protein CotF n=1 Tax=Tenuibacillus multivorans TaxID=237069 RepID=A0A1G9WSE0_9BACI|nr:spore coat protein [Tenuibacillus multivorans]GEL77958.1 spore coat protein F-like protein YhcQ [Tenuibacillus multivorans]SDM87053.1 Spore coat protein CotF [Tenuibacillus multivorans]